MIIPTPYSMYSDPTAIAHIQVPCSQLYVYSELFLSPLEEALSFACDVIHENEEIQLLS